MTATSLPGMSRVASDPPLGELLAEVAGHSQNIVRTEVRLAVAQLRAEVTAQTRHAVLLVGASVVALVGLVMLVIAGVMALAAIMLAWQAVLIGAGVFLFLSVLLALGARRQRA